MWLSDLALSSEAFISKTHFLCSLAFGNTEVSDTTQIELEQMECANLLLLTDHWTEGFNDRGLTVTVSNVILKTKPVFEVSC